MSMSTEHIIANGPEGLEEVLIGFLEKVKVDPVFAKQEHFILYQRGTQKSLIKVDTKQIPFKFWYYDLMGRPATVVVKEIIGKFLWEKCGAAQYFLAIEKSKSDVNDERH